MDTCKLCGQDLEGRGDYGNRVAVFCSDDCRFRWHRMNQKIERKNNAINKMYNELLDMLHETEDFEQRRQIEKMAYNIKFKAC